MKEDKINAGIRKDQRVGEKSKFSQKEVKTELETNFIERSTDGLKETVDREENKILWGLKKDVEEDSEDKTEDRINQEINDNTECHFFTSKPTPVLMGVCQDLSNNSSIALEDLSPIDLPTSVPLGMNTDLPTENYNKPSNDGDVVVSLQVPSYSTPMMPSTPPSLVPTLEKPQVLKPIRKTIKTDDEDDDSERLCADIATCDTLFIDIGAKETPELIAARNLKGKVKKKKDLCDNKNKKGFKSENNANESLNDEENNKINFDDSTLKDANQTEPKVKKKIKIVIGGKKPKTKLRRKNISKLESSP